MGAHGKQCLQMNLGSDKGDLVLRFIIVAAIVAMGIVLAGCSQAVTATSKASSVEPKSAPDSASVSATATTASDTSSDAVTADDFVGSWKVIQIANRDESQDEDPDDAGIPPESFKQSRERGLDSYFVFKSDGSAVCMMRGTYLYGDWKIDDTITEAIGGVTACVSLSYSDGGTMPLIMFFEGSRLALMMDDKHVIECKKAKDKKPLAKSEHDAALEAFVGTWHATSVTRNGATISVENGRLPDDVVLELKNTMKATMMWNGKSEEISWGITGADTGYVGYPDAGDSLTIAGGVLTEDLGEDGIISYVKE